MVEANGILVELFERIDGHVESVLDGIDDALLNTPPAPGTNPVGWLVWHLTRVQDSHIAELVDDDQIWVTGGWAERFGVAADPHNSGYGHSPEEVAAIQPDGVGALLGYYDAVATRTRAFLDELGPEDLDRIVDERWDPPVTMLVRLVSIADDDIQHAGQAAYARGLLHQGR